MSEGKRMKCDTSLESLESMQDIMADACPLTMQPIDLSHERNEGIGKYSAVLKTEFQLAISLKVSHVMIQISLLDICNFLNFTT